MSSNPFAGDMARLVGPRAVTPVIPPADSAMDEAQRRRADTERRAMQAAGMIPPDPKPEPRAYVVNLPPRGAEVADGQPGAEPSGALDLVALDLRAGEAVTTAGRHKLSDDEFALAAKIAIDAVNRQMTEQLISLAAQYHVRELIEKMTGGVATEPDGKPSVPQPVVVPRPLVKHPGRPRRFPSGGGPRPEEKP